MTQPDTGRFANALITGASSGIGAALARALSRPGAVVVLSHDAFDQITCLIK